MAAPVKCPRKARATQDGRTQIQQGLYEYLKTTVDPFDFGYELPAWRSRVGLPEIEEPEVEDLTDQQREDFANWLSTSGLVEERMRQDPVGSPPYLTLHAKEMLPKGTWLIHFTREKSFREFTVGTDMYGLHLSTWKKTKTPVDCARNLKRDRGIFETVFGFAYEVEGNFARFLQQHYGQYAVLFQCDAAISAYHDGDNERQVIFPLCSEYNVVQLSMSNGEWWATKKSGEDVTFPSVDAVIAYVERGARGSNQLQGLHP